jgi:hypothetical protein
MCITNTHTISRKIIEQPNSFFFCNTGAWTQGLHLELLHQPFWLRTMILLISASWVARITGMSHQHLLNNLFLFYNFNVSTCIYIWSKWILKDVSVCCTEGFVDRKKVGIAWHSGKVLAETWAFSSSGLGGSCPSTTCISGYISMHTSLQLPQ